MQTKSWNTAIRLGLGILALTTAGLASAHGWITSPPSRQEHCKQKTTGFDCGPVQYEPQSVEAPKGALSCSGGSSFSILDEERPWPATEVGPDLRILWTMTAPHRTQSWEYFLNGSLIAYVEGDSTRPGYEVVHNLHSLPEGRHTILARWNIGDTVMAFYNCVDVIVRL